jgi:cathepsin D
LSFPGLSRLKYTPIFDNIINKKLLKQNWFSFYIADYNESANSQVILGDPGKYFYEGDIHWHKVSEESYWQVEMEDVYINGKPINVCPFGTCKLVIDTGTSVITAPSENLPTLLDYIKLDDCNDVSSLPELGFRIGKYLYTMKPEEYILFSNHRSSMLEIESKVGNNFSKNNLNSESENSFEFNFQTSFSTTNTKSKNLKSNNKLSDCKRAFMPLDVMEPRGPLWVLGDIFLRKYFVIFDRDLKRIGIAVRRKNVDKI